MSDAADGFLARWARRKARVQSGLAEPAPQPQPGVPAVPVLPAEPLPRRASPAAVAAGPADPAPEQPGLGAAAVGASPIGARRRPDAQPPPTLDDVALLTADSDYSRFVGAGVEPGVSNAAMKKLFSDPHFNVMDGLDTYIDDYGKPDPIPPEMLRRMTQSAMLGLFDVEPPPDGPVVDAADNLPLAAASPDGAVPAGVAQSTPGDSPPEPAPELRSDDDPDLRLQQDDAAGRPGASPGARA